MAGDNTIENKIILKGEAEFKKSLAEINRSLKESKSALKAAAAEYDGAEDSMVAMYKQGDALERVLRDQESALRLMEEQLDKTESAYGKNSREATELRTKINNMRAEMARTETQIRQFAQRMDDAKDAMDGAGSGTDGIGEAIEKIGTDAEGAQGGVSGLIDKLRELSGLSFGGAGIGALGAAAGAGLKRSVELGDEKTQARGQIAAYTGKTGSELDALEEIGQNIYKRGFGDSLKDASQGVATLNTFMAVTGKELQESTELAFRLDDVFGMDIPESARTAKQMMTIFGMSGQEAYALIAAGAQEGADKNGNLLDTINEYAPYYAKAGKSAEEFMGSLTNGAQAGIYDIDKIGDAMKEFTLRIGNGSETTKEALKTLGLEAADVPYKFAQGGETASAAFDLVIDAIAKVEDPIERQNAAIALFGTQWEDTGGVLLEVFDEIGSTATDAAGAVESLNETRIDDLSEQTKIVGRRFEQAFADLGQPISKELANLLAEVTAHADETGQTWIDSFASVMSDKAGDAASAIGTVLSAESEIVEAAKSTGTLAGEAWGEKYAEKVAEAASDPNTVELPQPQEVTIDELLRLHSEAAGSGDAGLASDIQTQIDAAASAAVENVRNGEQQLTIDDLFAARAQAAGEGNMELVAQLDAQIEDTILKMRGKAVEGGEDVAVGAVEGVESVNDDMETAGEELGEEAVTALEDAQPDMMDAGEELGESGVLGVAANEGDAKDAGEDVASGTVSGMRSGIDDAYSAGYATGSAYERGVRDATDTHSPSRVMEDVAHDIDAGLLVGFKEDEARLYDAAAAMGEILTGGVTGGGFSGGAEPLPYGGGIDIDVMAQAMRQALMGLSWAIGYDEIARLVEPGVSQETSRRAEATVRGQASIVKGW